MMYRSIKWVMRWFLGLKREGYRSLSLIACRQNSVFAYLCKRIAAALISRTLALLWCMKVGDSWCLVAHCIELRWYSGCMILRGAALHESGCLLPFKRAALPLSVKDQRYKTSMTEGHPSMMHPVRTALAATLFACMAFPAYASESAHWG